jgi:hypothetical protein
VLGFILYAEWTLRSMLDLVRSFVGLLFIATSVCWSTLFCIGGGYVCNLG